MTSFRKLGCSFLFSGLILTLSTAAVAQESDNEPAKSQPLSLKNEISIDLIDLDALHQAINAQPGLSKQRMSLKDCVDLALKQNPDIIVTAYEPLKAEADAYSAKGEFDPVAQASASYIRSTTSATQEIALFGGIDTIESYKTVVNGTLSGKLHYGTTYQFKLDMSKDESTFGRFVEEFSGMATLTLTQPLMRGFGKDTNMYRIRAAAKSKEISEAQLQLSVMNAVADVTKSYWDLVGAVENLKVREGALANAQRLLDVTEKQRKFEAASDLDVLQAKAGVATRQGELIAARSRISDASDLLKQALFIQDNGHFSKIEIVPTDRPSNIEFTQFDPKQYNEKLESSVAKALEKRPEVRMTDLEIATAQLDQKRAKNEMLPQFDIFASYGQGGRDHKLSRTLYGIRDKQDDTYSYGVQGSIPIRNRAARGAYQRAKVTKKQAERKREYTMNGLMMNVHLASRQVSTNQILIESSRQAQQLQQANVLAEEKKLEFGASTRWKVLQIQEDLTAAQTQVVQSKIAYEKALVDLRLAEGAILDTYNIDFTAPDVEQTVGYYKSINPCWE